MPTSTMSSRGQTVIPKAIREHLGLHPGDVIDFVVADDGGVPGGCYEGPRHHRSAPLPDARR
jgi:AbrB family looped-hinge helix DNA binding protein